MLAKPWGIQNCISLVSKDRRCAQMLWLSQSMTPLFRRLLDRHRIVLVNVGRLPWIANPNVAYSPSCEVSVVAQHIIRKVALLPLVLVLGVMSELLQHSVKLKTYV